ncbi:MAG: aquaporin [Chloroflexi bacterium HGW-Chloroflexi-9]|nr:MAG: aquaporin [Chloroflexi bacterium HGW-Chloroflexi-9]
MSDALDPRKLIAEAVGTFTLTFAGVGAIVLAAGNANIGLLETALAQGLAVAVMFSALAAVSGGHFNPAVTAAMWVTRRMDSLGALGYVVAQLAGAVTAALVLTLLYPEGLRVAANLGTPSLGPTVDLLPGIGIEAVLTFFLVIVFFGTAIDARAPKIGGLAIGLTITADILAGGPLTGAAMNPARAFGPALLSGSWDDHLVWWIGPIIGGVVAGLLYHYVFSEEAK